jgi:hypothetical protein
MSPQDLLNLISTLSREQQEAVEEFVRILKKEKTPGMAFREALDEFVGKHPELLRRLALVNEVIGINAEVGAQIRRNPRTSR